MGVAASLFSGSKLDATEFVSIGNQVKSNNYVDDENSDAERPGSLVNLVTFQRDQRAGREDRQQCSPAFARQQPDPFYRMQRGVKEGPDLDQMKLSGLQAGDPGDRKMDEPVLGIEVKVANDLFQACGHVALEKPEETKTHRHPEYRSDQLQHSDDLDSQRTLDPARDQWFLPSTLPATSLLFGGRAMSASDSPG
jgi:hypothetical protein